MRDVMDASDSSSKLVSVLAQAHNIDIQRIRHIWSGSLSNRGSVEAINRKLTDGYVILSIQTEYVAKTYRTMVYMVRLSEKRQMS